MVIPPSTYHPFHFRRGEFALKRRTPPLKIMNGWVENEKAYQILKSTSFLMAAAAAAASSAKVAFINHLRARAEENARAGICYDVC
jgi:hypothetical protein